VSSENSLTLIRGDMTVANGSLSLVECRPLVGRSSSSRVYSVLCMVIRPNSKIRKLQNDTVQSMINDNEENNTTNWM